MKHEPATRHHTPEDPPPTVIHHPERDDTLLAQWLRRGMERGASFWIIAAGLLALVVGFVYFVGGRFSGESSTGKVWSEVMLAQSPEALQKIAESAETTEAGGWAGLRASTARYREAIAQLPGDRAVAGPILAQVLEGYRTVEQNAKNDDTLRRLAMLGIARTYETRDELSDAISTYEKIAKGWPNTEDGKAASARAKLLQDPDSVAFYKAFADYKTKTSLGTLGPRGANALNLPPGHPGLDDPAMPAPSLLGGPGVTAGSVPSPEGELPRNVFQSDKPKDKEPGASKTDPLLPDVFPKETPK